MNVKFFIIILLFYIECSCSMDCSQRQENLLGTKCGKIYKELRKEKKINNGFNFYDQWKYYKNECSQNGEFQMYLGDALQADGKEIEAQKILQTIINDKGKIYDVRAAYWSLMYLLMKTKNYDEAKKVALEAIVHYPKWYRGYLNYGELMLYENKFTVAKEYLEHSIMLQDQHSEAYAALAVIYRIYFKDHNIATKIYKKAIAIQNDKVLFSKFLATDEIVRSAMMEKDFRLAIWMLEKQKELFPKVVNEEWYAKLSTQVYSYLKKNNITEVLTPEEYIALKSNQTAPLDIIGKS